MGLLFRAVIEPLLHATSADDGTRVDRTPRPYGDVRDAGASKGGACEAST